MNRDQRHANRGSFEPPAASGAAPRQQGETFVPLADEAPRGAPQPIDADAAGGARSTSFEVPELGRKPLRGMRWLGALSFSYVAALLIYHTYDLAQLAWRTHWSVGALFGLVVGGGLLSLGVVWRAWRRDHDNLTGVHRLQREARRFRERRSHGHIQPYLQDLTVFYAHKPQAEALARMRAQLPDYADDSEALQYIERHFVDRLDQQAYACISHYSTQTGLAVALSPWAPMDMLLTLWRNLKMIDALTRIYGIRPSYRNRLRILTQVLNNMAFAGATQMASDYVASIGDSPLLPQLMGRVGQGLGSALISTRIGLLTLHQCRPIAFDDGDTPKIRDFLKPIGNRLLATLKANPELQAERSRLGGKEGGKTGE